MDHLYTSDCQEIVLRQPEGRKIHRFFGLKGAGKAKLNRLIKNSVIEISDLFGIRYLSRGMPRHDL